MLKLVVKCAAQNKESQMRTVCLLTGVLVVISAPGYCQDNAFHQARNLDPSNPLLSKTVWTDSAGRQFGAKLTSLSQHSVTLEQLNNIVFLDQKPITAFQVAAVLNVTGWTTIDAGMKLHENKPVLITYESLGFMLDGGRTTMLPVFRLKLTEDERKALKKLSDIIKDGDSVPGESVVNPDYSPARYYIAWLVT